MGYEMTAATSVLGTMLPVATHGDLWPLIVAGMDTKPKVRDGKLSPDGRATYSTGCILSTVQKNGEAGINKSATINVVNPDFGGYAYGTYYRAVGVVWVMPYEANSRVALSITAESLEPITKAAAK